MKALIKLFFTLYMLIIVLSFLLALDGKSVFVDESEKVDTTYTVTPVTHEPYISPYSHYVECDTINGHPFPNHLPDD